MTPTVFEAIIRHKAVYESSGYDVPPYRVTCKEHKDLVTYIKKSFQTDKDGMIAELYGVQLEVVMVVEPYL